MKQYRHGDLFIQAATIPPGVKPTKGGILAYGEATGHHHSIAPLKLTAKYMLSEGRASGPVRRYVTGAELLKLQGMVFQGGRKAPTLYEQGGQIFFRCHNTTVLTHQEHGSIVIPPGDYANVIQREYQPKAAPRRVID